MTLYYTTDSDPQPWVTYPEYFSQPAGVPVPFVNELLSRLAAVEYRVGQLEVKSDPKRVYRGVESLDCLKK